MCRVAFAVTICGAIDVGVILYVCMAMRARAMKFECMCNGMTSNASAVCDTMA